MRGMFGVSLGKSCSKVSPSEVAVINFSTKTLRPLLKSCPWYAEDNYSVMCDYNEEGRIDLTVHYAPPRFSEE